jgi:hypothetical protein
VRARCRRRAMRGGNTPPFDSQARACSSGVSLAGGSCFVGEGRVWEGGGGVSKARAGGSVAEEGSPLSLFERARAGKNGPGQPRPQCASIGARRRRQWDCVERMELEEGRGARARSKRETRSQPLLHAKANPHPRSRLPWPPAGCSSPFAQSLVERAREREREEGRWFLLMRMRQLCERWRQRAARAVLLRSARRAHAVVVRRERHLKSHAHFPPHSPHFAAFTTSSSVLSEYRLGDCVPARASLTQPTSRRVTSHPISRCPLTHTPQLHVCSACIGGGGGRQAAGAAAAARGRTNGVGTSIGVGVGVGVGT